MIKVRIITNKPVAFDSPDHLNPWGTARDNSLNRAFNLKLKWWLGGEIKLLDLGCAGGGFVKSILDQGDFALGIEGSDYSKIRKRAEWATIPDYLFTADITEPFQILGIDELGRENQIKFNVITLWEVLEHLPENKLSVVFDNINKHLLYSGVVIASVSTKEEIIEEKKLHQTVRDSDWWIKKIGEFNFVNNEKGVNYFGVNWVRGVGIDKDSFNIVLVRKSDIFPNEQKLKLLTFLVRPMNMFLRFVWGAIRFSRRLIPEVIKRYLKEKLK